MKEKKGNTLGESSSTYGLNNNNCLTSNRKNCLAGFKELPFI
jgi:hypothetical protein